MCSYYTCYYKWPIQVPDSYRAPPLLLTFSSQLLPSLLLFPGFFLAARRRSNRKKIPRCHAPSRSPPPRVPLLTAEAPQQNKSEKRKAKQASSQIKFLLLCNVNRTPSSYIFINTFRMSGKGKGSSNGGSGSSYRGNNGESGSYSNSYSYKGTNESGNTYRSGGAGTNYHYSNSDGSYHYQNSNGSTYHNDGQGNSTYKK